MDSYILYMIYVWGGEVIIGNIFIIIIKFSDKYDMIQHQWNQSSNKINEKCVYGEWTNIKKQHATYKYFFVKINILLIYHN